MSELLWPKIMLTGANGQVGWELQRTLVSLGHVYSFNRKALGLSNPEKIKQCVREIKPDLIVNAAAYTAVDKAEEEPELARAVNGIAPAILAEEAKKLNSVIVHYSTDYVFDGNNKVPYTEADIPNPINVYGRTKLDGEKGIIDSGAHYLIFRTCWVYSLRGKNFLLTILRLAKEKEELRIVNDQLGSPTWSRLISEITAQILAHGRQKIIDKQGLYNVSAGGKTTWFDFANRIVEFIAESGQEYSKLIPVSTSEYKTTAKRPLYSVLSNEKLKEAFGIKMPDWEHSLKLALGK